MKKILISMFVLVLLAFNLVGCTKTKNNTKNESSKINSKANSTVSRVESKVESKTSEIASDIKEDSSELIEDENINNSVDNDELPEINSK